MSLPNAQPIIVSPEITIQPPLTRRGTGPGLILVVPPAEKVKGTDRFWLERVLGGKLQSQKYLDPEPLKKWAEEGYAVAQVTYNDDLAREWEFRDRDQTSHRRLSPSGNFGYLVRRAMAELEKVKECEGVEKVGLVVHAQGDINDIASVLAANPRIACCVWYSFSNGLWAKRTSIPVLAHTPGRAPQRSEIDRSYRLLGKDVYPDRPPTNLKSHYYPTMATPLHYNFALPSSVGFSPSAASVAHTRSLTFLKPLLGGPYFDLEAIWDEHTKYEFEDRSVEKTMATMVDQPYVNHIPTLSGGIGRENLTKFYRDRFIHSNAKDTQLELVSRTVGIDRIVDEFFFYFTHDRVVDWLIPGIPPTHRKLCIPFTSIVNIRGDRFSKEHIAWDQGTVLRQLGLLPEYLPFPYALPDGRQPGEGGKRFEYRVPVAGVETADKFMDELSVESNPMLGYEVREVEFDNVTKLNGRPRHDAPFAPDPHAPRLTAPVNTQAPPSPAPAQLQAAASRGRGRPRLQPTRDEADRQPPPPLRRGRGRPRGSTKTAQRGGNTARGRGGGERRGTPASTPAGTQGGRRSARIASTQGQ